MPVSWMSGPCRFSPPWGVAIPTNAPVTGRRLRPDSLKTVPEPSQSHLDRPKFVPNAGAPVGRATTRGGGYDPVLPMLAPLEDLLGWFWDEFERDLGADHLIFHMHVRSLSVTSGVRSRRDLPAQPIVQCIRDSPPQDVFPAHGPTRERIKLSIADRVRLPRQHWKRSAPSRLSSTRLGRDLRTAILNARVASNVTTVEGGTRLR